MRAFGDPNAQTSMGPRCSSLASPLFAKSKEPKLPLGKLVIWGMSVEELDFPVTEHRFLRPGGPQIEHVRIAVVEKMGYILST
jgi:hypothetical protein